MANGMRNGFEFYFLDRIYRIDGILFACGEMPSAEGRSILLILSNCFSNIRIHSSFFSIWPAVFLPGGWADTRHLIPLASKTCYQKNPVKA